MWVWQIESYRQEKIVSNLVKYNHVSGGCGRGLKEGETNANFRHTLSLYLHKLMILPSWLVTVMENGNTKVMNGKCGDRAENLEDGEWICFFKQNHRRSLVSTKSQSLRPNGVCYLTCWETFVDKSMRPSGIHVKNNSMAMRKHQEQL